METAFTKVVTDAYGFDWLLIEGQIVKFDAPQDKNNELVDVVSLALRANRSGLCGMVGKAKVVGLGEQDVGG